MRRQTRERKGKKRGHLLYLKVHMQSDVQSRSLKYEDRKDVLRRKITTARG